MQFTIFTANCTGNAGNCSYPNEMQIVTPEQLRSAVAADHVCATYKDNYRSNENFIKSDVLVMDIDNDHTDDPAQFITAEKMDELFQDIDYCLVPSRNHNKKKGSHPAAPRYHVFFPVKETTAAAAYADMKVKLQKAYPFFDDNALDAARFLYGCQVSEVIWHEGWMSIEDEIEDAIFDTDTDTAEDFDAPTSSGPILEGSRNRTMSHFAGRVLKRYGNTDKAKEVYLEHSKKCDPPLEAEELETIWNSAVRFFVKCVVTQEGYVPPEELMGN